MKTKLRSLAFLGLILVVLPIVYIPTTFVKVLIALIGVLILYIAWRIGIAYRRALHGVRPGMEQPHTQGVE